MRHMLRTKTTIPGAAQAAQVAHGAAVAPHSGLLAIADEGWSELRALQTSARRKHIHWTHVRTHDAAHRQPDIFTKQAFWGHLLPSGR
mgnify:CR=1 FL=1